MSLWPAHHVPLVDSVLHPTDFSSASDTAFAHALAIALIRKTKFTILHVGAGTQRSVPLSQARCSLCLSSGTKVKKGPQVDANR